MKHINHQEQEKETTSYTPVSQSKNTASKKSKFIDNRPESLKFQEFQEMANNSGGAAQTKRADAP